MELPRTKEIECPHCGYANDIVLVLSEDKTHYSGTCEGCGTTAIQGATLEFNIFDRSTRT